MQFEYVRPREDIRTLVGSYYNLTVQVGLADVMRAEIANLRFIIRGCVYSDLGGSEVAIPAGSVILCGPTFRWSNIRFDADTVVFGAAITPIGWSRLMKVSADACADKILPFARFLETNQLPLIQQVLEAPDAQARANRADEMFAALNDPEVRVNEDFLMQATQWIADPEPNELDDLLARTDLSAR